MRLINQSQCGLKNAEQKVHLVAHLIYVRH